MEKLAAVLLMVFVINACTTPGPETPDPCCIPPLNLVDPPKVTPKTKSYVVWNKRQFIKPRGLVTMSQSTIFALAEKFGAENMKPLDDINGFTIKNASPDSHLSFTSDDWVVQEEQIYYALETLYRLTPVEVNNPTCPVCPNPNPNPTPEPGPTENAKSWGLTRMKALEAKGKVSTKNVKVCVVDTGIDLSHPDRGNVVESISYTGEPVSPDPGQHGTHVAGTVAGRRGSGVGVSEAALYVCKGLSNNGSGSSSSLAQCLRWCKSKGAHISSNSWGGGGPDGLINQAVAEIAPSVAVVFAAGNENRGSLSWPAAMANQVPNVYAVSSSAENDRRSSFSNYGPGTSYIAPGSNIISNRPGGGTQPMSGTSMATPGVAGAMAYCVAMGKPVTCLRTLDLGLGTNVQGKGMPDLLQTVNQ